MSNIDRWTQGALRHDRAMPLTHRQLLEEHSRYRMAELVQLRREILLYARSTPPGPERNQHRQVAVSLRTLFRNRAWLDTHTLERSQ